MGVKVGCQTYGWAAYSRTFGFRYPVRCVLSEVAKAGYKGVDLSGYTIEELGSAESFKSLLKEFKLKLVSMSNGIGDPEKKLLKRTKKNFQWLAELGVKVTMVGGGYPEKGESPEDAFKRLTEQCDELEEFGRKVGVKPAFHNHLHSLVETEEQIIRFLESTSMGWCADTGHMAAAGCNPLKMIKKYKRKLRMGHLKDVLLDRRGKFVRFIELGKGNAGINIKRILNTLDELKFNGWFTVEQDQTTVTPGTDQFHNAMYLRKLGYLGP